MTHIKLSKILSAREESNILKEMLAGLKIDVLIKGDKEVIYGNNPDLLNKKEFPIAVEDSIIGYVYGEEKASAVVSLIEYFVSSENEKRKLAEDALDKYREINLLYKISEKIASSQNLNDAAGMVIFEAMKYIDSTCSSVLLLDDESGRLETSAEFRRKPNFKVAVKSIKPIITGNISIINDVLLTGRAEIVNDMNRDPRSAKDNIELKSMMFAPMSSKGRIIGVMAIGNENKVTYTSQDLGLFCTFAFQTAVAVENAKLYMGLREAFYETVNSLSEAIEKRDTNTAGHAKRVVNYSLLIGREMGMPQVDLIKLKLAALLHDIGKIGISDWILLKKGKLTSSEFEIIKKHSEIGSNILKNIKQLKDIIPGVRGHHERYDGLGYPDGLRGNEVPLIARIIAVADYYDALTSERPYKNGMGEQEALQEISDASGSHFDPEIVAAFLRAFTKNTEEDNRNLINE